MLSASFSSAYGQCASGSFNCNDTIQVSVDEMCEAIISTDFILEKPEETCTYELQFFDENDNLLNVPGNVLGVDYVGRIIKVKVLETGVNNPNSCWGYIRVEDKIPAIIDCPEFESYMCLDSDQNDPGETDEQLAAIIRRMILAQDGIQDNCTDTASFEVSIVRNQLQQLLCSDDFGAQRFIEFDLIGAAGEVILNCVDTIFFSKFDSDEVEDPRDFIGDDALECDGTSGFGDWEQDIDQEKLDEFGICIYPNFWELFDLDESSFPHVGGRPIVEYDEDLEAFVRVGFCNINAAFIDLPPFEICGKSYKLIRRWTIIDWCKNSPPRVVNQIIEVKDTKPPIYSLPNIPDVDAGSNTCNMVVDLPVPTVTDECNDWTFCIEYMLPGTSVYTIETKYQNLDSTDTPDPLILPIGTSGIRYIVKDVCGNADTTRMDVNVNDVQPPIAICDTRTVLTLNNNDKGKIFPPTIDDKSFDNCDDNLIFRIWREDGKTELNAPDSSFVKFDAFDIDQDVRVMLEVEDESGMKNRCWTTVEVKSNTSVAPACPSSIGTLDFCNDFSSYLPQELGLEAVELERQETGCGEGYLVVQYIDTSNNTNSVLCTGDTIFFERLNTINTSDFAVPLDIEVSECDNIEPTSQDLADILSNSGACNFVEVIFQDVIFSEKVFRNYTIVDLCTNLALMHHTQIIEIVPSDLGQIDLGIIFDVPVPGATVEMEEDGDVEIPASFFNIAEGDPCYSNLDIRVRKRDEAGDFAESVIFNCDDIALVVVFDLEVALFDSDGQIVETKFTKVLIDDRASRACPSGSVNISGLIQTEELNAVENVSIELMSVDNQSVSSTASGADGQYAFTEMTPSQYKVITSKNDDMINGVSTLDLVLIQQHILGVKPFDSPYKVIAADINNNESVSAIDLLDLRRVILGISDSFTNNSSWRFINADQTFNDVLNPWGFDESHDILGEGEFNFIGVKVGDVNANVIANSLMINSRSNESLGLDMEINSGHDNSKSVIEFSTSEVAMAFQVKLELSSGIKVSRVLDNEMRPLDRDEYILNEGEVVISHILNAESNELFALEIEGHIEDLDRINSQIALSGEFKNEWYSSEHETKTFGILSSNKESIEIEAFPNPFKDKTTLHIFSKSNDVADINVFDINGKKIFTRPNVNLNKGLSQITIASTDLFQTSGIYMYEVRVDNQNIRGKIIYLD